MKMQSRKSVISAGFDAHGSTMNNLLLQYVTLEIIPTTLHWNVADDGIRKVAGMNPIRRGG